MYTSQTILYVLFHNFKKVMITWWLVYRDDERYSKG